MQTPVCFAVVFLLLLAFGNLTTNCAAAPSAAAIDFQRDIQPIFARHCLKCHGPEMQESNFRLDVKKLAMQGGDLGEPAIVPGKSGESFLIRAVSDPEAELQMPPEGERLTVKEVELLRAWIDAGAVWPDDADGDVTQLTTDHWSIQPLAEVRIPEINEPWITNAIDAFILSKLDSAGLRPSPQADRVMFIRRLYLDMLGLPPTPEEVNGFLSDEDPLAYERLVDRALSSPRFGERWARHWLDVVRFAESHGFETNRERPNAWPYRDYVIGAFNSDKPYEEFVKEQIAGDAYGVDVGTGFLVGGSYDIVKSPDINLTLMQRQDELADMVNTTGTTFLGLTLGCARCHNHKFDPILQRDFYALQAVFAGVNHGERPAWNGDAADVQKRLSALQSRLENVIAQSSDVQKSLGFRPPVNAKENVETFAAVDAKYVRFTILATNNGSQPCIDELEIYTAENRDDPSCNVALSSAGAKASSSSNLPGYEIHKLEHINDGQYGNGRSWISNEAGAGWVQIEFAEPKSINRIVWGRDRELKYTDRVATNYRIEVAIEPEKWQTIAGSDDRISIGTNADEELVKRIDQLPADRAVEVRELIAEKKSLEQKIEKLSTQPVVYAGTFEQPGPTHRLYRGDPMQKRELVAPDALTVTGTLALEQNAPEQERRVALAQWIVNEDNPLTARVIVNRLWHYHFGTGIVATPSDFGANGSPPSHPELLDWLAAELVRSGWSLKHIHRLILTSATYRQTSTINPQSAIPNPQSVDADCRLLWRFPPRRLEAESIRDAILSVSGNLDLQMGGQGFSLFDVQMENVRHYFPKETFGPSEWRRMIYSTKYRQEQDAVFGAFDCPDGNQTVPRRPTSTTPLQALNLLNSDFLLQQADLFAARLQNEAGSSPRDQAQRAFALAFNRSASTDELTASVEFIEQHGLPAFCRALMNANEFLFLP